MAYIGQHAVQATHSLGTQLATSQDREPLPLQAGATRPTTHGMHMEVICSHSVPARETAHWAPHMHTCMTIARQPVI